jgi:ABC-type multidrug transport system fused ATPase/permease subunit
VGGAVVAAARVVELGPHAELVSHEGRYASLWSSWTKATTPASP